MRVLGLTIVSAALLIAPMASARDFTVPANTPRKIGWQSSLNEDCSSLGDVVVRVTSQPQHGVVSIKHGRDNPNFAPPNPRTVCNVRKLPSTQVWYQPERGYLGPDSVSYETLAPNGTVKDDTVSITVR